MIALGQRGAGYRAAPPLAARTAVHARKSVAPSQSLGAVSTPVAEPVTAPPVVPHDTSTELPATGHSTDATVAPTPAPKQQPQPPYVWERHWVPVCPLDSLDPLRPVPVLLLGQPLVVWRHSVRGWVVMRDVCPHRLAPLSEGRMEAGGTRLACAYHGWEFSEEGECTKVPQLSSDPRAASTACGSPRSCVTSFPTLGLDGLLFVWLDASKEGLAASKAAPKPELTDDRAGSYFNWLMNEMPADYTFWLEQSMDPTHANFLHQGVDRFNSANALPLEGKADPVDPAGGFTWHHGGYQLSNKGMKASRQFQPPFINRICYEQPNGGLTFFWIVSVPVRPGVARVYFKGGFGRAAPPSPPPPQQSEPQHQQRNGNGAAAAAASASSVSAAGSSSLGANDGVMAPSRRADVPTAAAAAAGPQQDGSAAGKPEGAGSASASASVAKPRSSLFGRLFGLLPHWMYASQLIADQDLVMMARQEVLMRHGGLTARDYNLNSRADGGVAATTVWLRRAGYPESLWGGKPVVLSGPTYGKWPAQELTLEQLLSRQDRHVRHCAVCQRGLKLVTTVCAALTAAAGLAAMAAATLALMAAISPAGAAGAVAGGWWTVAGATALALALALAAVKGWSFREERFISGAAQWRRMGGFALQGSKAR